MKRQLALRILVIVNALVLAALFVGCPARRDEPFMVNIATIPAWKDKTESHQESIIPTIAPLAPPLPKGPPQDRQFIPMPTVSPPKLFGVAPLLPLLSQPPQQTAPASTPTGKDNDSPR